MLLLLSALGGLSGCSYYVASADNAEGVRLFQEGRFHEALQQFQEATYDEPLCADGYYNMAAAYHRIGLQEHQQTYLDQAEVSYNQCLDHNPNHRECYRGLAVLLAQEGRNDEAFRLLQGWVDRQPAMADPKIELARLYEERGQRSAAEENLIAALTVESSNPRALAALGRLRESQGQPGQALANYQRSLWYDREQPAVAARIAALGGCQPTGNAWTSPDSVPQMAAGPANPWR